MIDIRTAGGQAELAPGTSARLERPSGLLEFDGLAPSITQQLRLPGTPANRRIFGHIYRPASASGFAPQDATLEYRGLAVAEGQLVVTQSDRDEAGAFFRADAGALAEARERKIGDMLAHLHVPIGAGASPPCADGPFINGANDDVVFPPCVGRATPAYARSGRPAVRTDRSAYTPRSYDRNAAAASAQAKRARTEEFAATRQGAEEMVLYNMAPFYTYGRAVPKKYLPAFKIMHLLRELAGAVGYTLEASREDYTMRQAVLFAWRPAVRSSGERERSYSYFLPDMTLSEFIASVRAMGTAVYADSRRRAIVAKPFDACAQGGGADFSYCAEDAPEVSDASAEGESVFSWGEPSQQAPTRPAVKAPNLLPAPALGDIVLAENENRLYEAQSITVGDADFVDWRPIGPANGDGRLARGGIDAQCLFTPVASAQTFIFTAQNVRLRKEQVITFVVATPTASEKVRVEGLLYRGLKKGEVQYRIIEPAELSTGWFTDLNPAASASADPVLNIDYTKDYDNAVVEYRTTLPYFGERLMPEIPQEPGAYIALHHGERLSPLGEAYGYAGPTSVSPSDPEERIDEQDLTWASILARRMSVARRLLLHGKQAAHTLYPKLHDAIQFSPLEPVTIDGVRYLPVSLDMEMGDVLKAEFRGWVL
jgi:hypothetical protein